MTFKKKWSWKFRKLSRILGNPLYFEYSQVLFKYLIGKSHESDFYIFNRIEGESPLFLDIGANMGQSAFSISLNSKNSKIISYEPNPKLIPFLKCTKNILGNNFEFENMGVGIKNGVLNFFVPIVENIPLTQEGTFDKKVLLSDQVTKSRILAATGQNGIEIEKMNIPIIKIDNLDIRPDVIKIDVQGLESDVLLGAQKMISNFQPLIVIESSLNNSSQREILKPLNYLQTIHDAESNKLIPWEENSSPENIFYVPPRFNYLLSR